MSSAGWFRLNRSWAAGEVHPRRFDLGPCPANDPETPCSLGLLRVSYGVDGQAGLIRADVRLGDNGTVLSGLDVPFRLVCEVPVNVVLTPVSALPTDVTVTCSVCPAGSAPDDYAIRSVVAGLNEVVLLPQWVRAVTPIAPATFHFRASGGVALGSASAVRQVRPPNAFDFVVDAAGLVLLEY